MVLFVICLSSEADLFNQKIIDVINYLKRKHKRADIESIHKEINKAVDAKELSPNFASNNEQI